MLLKRLACCVLAVCSEANTTLLVPRAGRKEWETSNSPHAKWSEQLRFDDDGGSQNPVEFLLIAPPYASHGMTSPWAALGSDSVYY